VATRDIEILHADGTVERIVLAPGDRRASRDGWAFTGTDAGVVVQRMPGTAPMPSGTILPSGPVPWGTEVRVGAVRMLVGVERISLAPPGPADPPLPKQMQLQQQQQKASPVVLICGVVAAGVLAWTLLDEDPDASIRRAPRVPALIAAETETCTAAGGAPAAAQAMRDERAAEAKFDRYPFSPQDGVRAVQLYRRAQACHTAAGDSAMAARAGSRGERVRRKIDEDYATTRFRLSRAITSNRTHDARIETHTLLQLLGDRQDPYVDWLRDLERTLRLREMRPRAD
jgi:hypothetical protein